MITLKKKAAATLIMFLLLYAGSARAAGILESTDGSSRSLKIEQHDVTVIIQNGFAATRVTQIFTNNSSKTIEAIYSFPIPESASLSEFSVTSGEKTIHGEVVSKEKAEEIYGEEKKKGNDAAMAQKNGYQDFKFFIAGIKGKSKVSVSYLYYQPIKIDTGTVRYQYPLREGGTDDGSGAFWGKNNTVDGIFSVTVQVKSAFPLSAVRSPGYSPISENGDLQSGTYTARYQTTGAKLNNDFVFYYKLADNMPGQIELIPYKKPGEKGSFMLILSPGIDLEEITAGSDYIFIIDRSGSMEDKIQMVCKGVSASLGKLNAKDRFKIITFNESADELTSGWANATPENVQKYINEVMNINADGSTNLFDGIAKGVMSFSDEKRVTSVILITDAVANTGEVDPSLFYKMMKRTDIRVFGFLMGNDANWPLMRLICEASGGYYEGVSNSDDIIGQVLKAKSKITHEALHDASLEIDGITVTDMTDQNIGKVFRGQQLVFFGRYAKSGKAKVTLKTKISGKEKKYSSTIDFPESDTDNPEIDRLWALNNIEMTEDLMNRKAISEADAKKKIKTLGLENQIVTDETSMIVLSDETFSNYGIERKNRERLAYENAAAQARNNQPVKSYRSDRSSPTFRSSFPRLGGGGGAIDPFTGISLLLFGAFGCIAYLRMKRKEFNKQK